MHRAVVHAIAMLCVWLAWPSPVKASEAASLPRLRLEVASPWYAPGETVALRAIMENVPGSLGALSAELRVDPMFFLQPSESDVAFWDAAEGETLLGGPDHQAVVTAEPNGYLRVNIANPNGITPGITTAFYLRLTVRNPAPDGNGAIWFEELTPGATGGNGVHLLSMDDTVLPDAEDHLPANVPVRLPGALTGLVQLDRGLASSPDSDFSGTLVELMNGGVTGSAVTSADGTFSMYRVLPGTYDVRVSRPIGSGAGNHLTVLLQGVPVPRGGIRELGTLTLVPGNILDTVWSTDSAYLEDLSAMAKAWGTTANPRADLDGDGLVSSNDLYLLAKAWGLAGAGAPVPSPGFVTAYTATAPVATSLALSANKTAVQHTDVVDFEATLSPALQGQFVGFALGDSVIGYGQTDSAGTARLSARIGAGAGDYVLTAFFPGLGDHLASADTVALTVTRETAALTFPVEMAANGTDTVTLTVKLTEEADGSTGGQWRDVPVSFLVMNSYNDPIASGHALADRFGTASFQLGILPAGSYAVEAFVADNPYFAADTATGTIMGVPVIGLMQATAAYSDSVTLTASFTPATGAKVIRFRVGSQEVGTAATDGSGLARLPMMVGLPAGEYGVEAFFEGDPAFRGASAVGTYLTVVRESGTLTYTGDVTIDEDMPLSVSAVFAPAGNEGPGDTPGNPALAGVVRFDAYLGQTLVASSSLAPVGPTGEATSAISGLAVGSYTVKTILLENSYYTADPVFTEIGPSTPSQSADASRSSFVFVADDPSLPADGTGSLPLLVRARDAEGNDMAVGGDAVVLSLSAPSLGSLSQVTDHGDGTYTATFSAGTERGIVQISATLNGATVGITTVYVGYAEPASAELSWDSGELPADGESWATLWLTIYDSPAPGQDAVAFVQSSPAVGTFSEVADYGDGYYEVTFTAGAARGIAHITAMVNGGVAGTATITVGYPNLEYTTVEPSRRILKADGASTTTITLVARDANGYQLAYGGDEVEIFVHPDYGSVGNVTDHNNGTYTAVFTAGTMVGWASVWGTINGAEVGGYDGIDLRTPTNTSPAHSTISVTPSTLPASNSETATITVQARDSSGTPVTVGGDYVDIHLVNARSWSVTDHGNGTYSAVVWLGASVGTYVFSATINEEPIGSTVGLTIVPGPASAAKSTMSVTPQSIEANGASTATLTITVKDAFENIRTAGGDTVTVSSQYTTPGALTDNGNGTYTAILVAGTVSGSDEITATVNGETLAAKAYLNVYTGPVDLAVSTAGVSPTPLPADGTSKATVTVVVKDSHGNIRRGFDDVTITTTLGSIGPFVTYNEDGTYTADFIAGTTPGTATIPVKVNGEPLTISPTILLEAP